MAHGIIWWVVVGLVAGWVAGKIMKGGGYGVFADILLGIVGAIVGGWAVGLLGFGTGGLIWSILVAILGAVILIWITRLIKKEVYSQNPWIRSGRRLSCLRNAAVSGVISGAKGHLSVSIGFGHEISKGKVRFDSHGDAGPQVNPLKRRRKKNCSLNEGGWFMGILEDTEKSHLWLQLKPAKPGSAIGGLP